MAFQGIEDELLDFFSHIAVAVRVLEVISCMTRTGEECREGKLNSRDCHGKQTPRVIRNTSMTESWEEIWEKSQLSLEAIRTSVSALASPTPRVLRVSQLDAESLDTELAQLLREPVANAFSVVNVRLYGALCQNGDIHTWILVSVEVEI
jgi:hypothetical protein